MLVGVSRGHLDGAAARASILLRAVRPAQWVKNGVVFAGLVFGGKLFELDAVASAILAFVWFSLLSSGFYLINDVRDMHADACTRQSACARSPPESLSPVAAGRWG